VLRSPRPAAARRVPTSHLAASLAGADRRSIGTRPPDVITLPTPTRRIPEGLPVEHHRQLSTTDNDNTDTGRGDLARVHYLPATDQPAEAIEGEIITDEEYRRLTSQKAQALARYQGYRRDIVATGRVVRTVATHDRSKTAGKAVLRHGSYAFGGVGVVAKRMWQAKTNSRAEQAMRAFEVAGDWEKGRGVARPGRERQGEAAPAANGLAQGPGSVGESAGHRLWGGDRSAVRAGDCARDL
jgi:hypothetical protein